MPPAQLNYTGTFVYQHGDRGETSRITHFVDANGGEYEKLETLDGPRREIIRNNNEVLTFFFDTRRAAAGARAPRARRFRRCCPSSLRRLTQNYELRKGDRERVAGYDAQALMLEPRDEFRYGHKLWAEMKSGLLLKARMLNENRQVDRAVPLHAGQDQCAADARLGAAQLRPATADPPRRARIGGHRPIPAGSCATSPPGFKKIMEMKRVEAGRQACP